MTKIIGITGHYGAGKDAAIAKLEGYVHLRFADGLKAMLGTFLAYRGVSREFTRRLLEDRTLKDKPTQHLFGNTPRHAMQSLGTEWGRECIHPDIWVRTTIDRALGFDKAVITDARFPNEFMEIHEVGGIVIRIKRPGCGGDGHESERYIDEASVDFEIVNDGTIEELQEKMIRIVEPLRGQRVKYSDYA